MVGSPIIKNNIMAKKEQQGENLRFYEQMRNVPDHAKKTIRGGRLNNFTDINPVWRIKVMTEAFGPCGIGWKYEIVRQWNEAYGNEVKSFTTINLYIKVDGQWSDAIPGTGGATLVEAKGYVSDEGYKMSLTDALSVAMKSLGVAADIYFGEDAQYDTKYAQQEYIEQLSTQKPATPVKDQYAATYDAAVKLIKPEIQEAKTIDQLTAIWKANPALQNYSPFQNLMTTRKNELNASN